LLDGFEVAAGSRLVGPVFVDRRDGRESWTAVLEIADDPVGVYDRYAEQARALDIPVPASTAIIAGQYGVCSLAVGAGSVPLIGHDAASAQWLECQSGGLKGDDSLAVSLHVVWGRTAHHAVITVDHDAVRLPSAARTAPSERAPRPARLPPMTPAQNATKPGTPFGAENNPFEAGYRRFRLVEGSTVASDAPFLLATTVLHVDGEARAVMESYADQLGGRSEMTGKEHTPEVETIHTSRGDILMVENSPLGGGYARLLTDPTGEWISVTTTGD
jgi:hypothetical protein